MLYTGNFQMWRYFLATTEHHKALLVCEWLALGMPWGTARSNAASAALSRGFSRFRIFSVMEVVLINQSAQSPASLCVASPGHIP